VILVPEDIDRWMGEGRTDILSKVCLTDDGYEFPVNPVSGRLDPICLFLIENGGEHSTLCTIYPTRPLRCRKYTCEEKD